ncbi:MAG TPA: hypothetical protein VK742_12465 [Candidatus Sulfotelmatobacter sp.]|jgi:hypothetical protein|nr:hypothetical protein [Candidatus Sulfotelmatobacter sp.]
MQRFTVILARLIWTFSAIGGILEMAIPEPDHPLSILHWCADFAIVATGILCWLSYPWAWMTAGVTGFLGLAYQVYVTVIIWLMMAGVHGIGEPNYRVSYGPIHISGFIAQMLMWGEPLFCLVVTVMFAYFGACRSDAKADAKNHA